MRILVIENFRHTPLGQLETALRERGAEIDLRAPYRGGELPGSHEGYGALVILGGGQNALDDDVCPWLSATADLSRAFGDADKAVLGVCLGAQLIARGYGGENILGREVEFGWRMVTPVGDGRNDPVIGVIGEGAPLFHWHEDTVTLPPSATLLAESEMTSIQAFRIGRAVYGVQFHLEADRRVVARWNGVFADEIAEVDPGWMARYPVSATSEGQKADIAGLSIARAWTGLIR